MGMPNTVHVFLTLLASLLLLLPLPATTSSVATAATPEQCRTWGFDPSNLSCDTCTHLSTHPSLVAFMSECEACCQPYRVASPPAPTRYKFATLVYDPTFLERYSEIKSFVDEDVETVKKAKGGFRLSQVEGGGYSGPKLLFFNMGGRVTTEDADKVVELDWGGWKRDDVREMVMALLLDN